MIKSESVAQTAAKPGSELQGRDNQFFDTLHNHEKESDVGWDVRSKHHSISQNKCVSYLITFELLAASHGNTMAD